MPRFPAIALSLFMATGSTPSVAGEVKGYMLDPVHTRVLVAVEHAGFSQALGTVSGSEGHLLFDPDDWSTARLEVSVPLDRIDFGDADWNRAVARRGLLDTANHPHARFVSTRVTGHDPHHACVCGELTLRDTTRPLCMEVTLNALGRHPLPPFRRTVGFSATATLSRADYGIDAWKSVIGDRVTLRIEAEATRSARAARAFVQAAPAATVDDERMDDDVTPAAADTYRTLEEAAEAALQDEDSSPNPPPPPDDEPTP